PQLKGSLSVESGLNWTKTSAWLMLALKNKPSRQTVRIIRLKSRKQFLDATLLLSILADSVSGR
ncbi:MAG: hypothetical protein AB8B96_19720, partial [Lysobacterales bacterium]